MFHTFPLRLDFDSQKPSFALFLKCDMLESCTILGLEIQDTFVTESVA